MNLESGSITIDDKHYALVGMDDLLRILRIFEYQRRKVGLFPEQAALHEKLRKLYIEYKESS